MKRLTGCLLAVSLLWGGTAAAQAPPLPLEITGVDVAAHPQVAAVLVAPAALAGAALEPGAVTISEAGQARPVEVARLPDDRLEVVLVIDTSGSMQGAAAAAAKDAARAFVERLPGDARIALVSFGSAPVLASPLAEDRGPLLDAIGGLGAQGETALYDAVRLATEQFTGEPDSRRQLIVLSDGGDTASALPVEGAVESITASGAKVDVVELVTTETARGALDQLAAAGAGQVAPAGDPSALAGIYDALARSLVSEYAISWPSASHAVTEVVVRLEQGGVVAERALRLEYPPAPPTTTTTSSTTTTEPQAVAAPLAPPTSGNATWMLVVGAICVAVALGILGFNVFLPSQRRQRLARLGAPVASVGQAPSALRDLTARATAAADGALHRSGRRSQLDSRLEQAGIPLRAGEYVVLAASATAIAFAVGFLSSGSLLGAILVLLTGAVAHLVPSVLRARRRRRFSDQLGDTLQLLAGSLRAGYGLLQAIDALSKESPEPTRGEFRRLVIETRLGRDLSEALAAMAERLDTDDFEWVVQAIAINREVGGDLAEVLDTVGGTIRERNTVLRQVKALTAEGRLSAYILLALPIVLALAMQLINPDYIRLLTFGPGLLMTGAAAVMLSIGALWFRALCRVDY